MMTPLLWRWLPRSLTRAWGKKPLPTDLEILDAIYERYSDEFGAYSTAHRNRQTKIYVPIDIIAIAKTLKVDDDIVFGRLYYQLDKKHGYTNEDDGTEVHLYYRATADGERDIVNFPLLASVLAALRDEDRKFLVATWASAIALLLSVISLLVSIFKKGGP